MASTPAVVDVNPQDSINTLLANRVQRIGSGTALRRRDSDQGPWLNVSALQFDAQVLALAQGIIARGINVHDRVAIMSRTRYEWTLLDFALWAVGAVPVPVYETSSPDQVEHILSDCGARWIIVETQAHEDIVASVRQRVPGLEEVFTLDKGALGAIRDSGLENSEQLSEQVRQRSQNVVGDDLATIIYTSGSTGQPKGVELTHGNFVHVSQQARGALVDVLEKPGKSTLLFLPLAHVFARLIQVAVIASHSVLGHAPDIKHLTGDLQSFQPTFLLVVPRVLEKVYNSAAQKASHTSVKRLLFHQAVRASISHSRAMDNGQEKLTHRIAFALGNALVLSKLRAAMGGKVEYAVSGGAPLGTRLGHFFRGMGITVLEGYGLTETTAPTSVNIPGFVGMGTVGPALPGTSIRIDDDGEVLLAGPHLFRAYHNNPELTAQAFVDDADGQRWFCTGDIGSLNDRGLLTITGRKKELIVTAGGKNVSPALLEDRLRSHPLVSQVVVVGDERPFIAALVTLDAAMLPGWLATHNLPSMSAEEARSNPVVLQRLQRAVDRANRAVSRAESIRKFAVLPGDFTEENGYLTPSMKIKRSLILHDYAAEIDGLYGQSIDSEHNPA